MSKTNVTTEAIRAHPQKPIDEVSTRPIVISCPNVKLTMDVNDKRSVNVNAFANRLVVKVVIGNVRRKNQGLSSVEVEGIDNLIKTHMCIKNQ